MTNLVIAGIRGRMGQALVRLVRERENVRIIAGAGRERLSGAAAEQLGCPVVVPFTELGDVAAEADVVVDFSSASGTEQLLEHAAPALAGRALLTGTTGLAAGTERALDELAGSAAVLAAANFSVGVNLLLGLVERVAAVLEPAAFDVEVVEAHHRGKTDAPSGTALALGRAIAAGRAHPLHELRQDGRSGDVGRRREGEIGFHAVRGGVIGEHRVLFLGGRESIELRHEALDRAVFADGALQAAVWLAGRPAGRYGMKQFLGL